MPKTSKTPPDSVCVSVVRPSRAVPVPSMEREAVCNAFPSTGAWRVWSMKSMAARLYV